MITKLEELRKKENSYKDLGEHKVGTGLWSYETSIKLPLDSPNHNSCPMDSEWFREAVRLNWDAILKSLRIIAEADIAQLKADAVIEAGKFLKQVGNQKDSL